MVPNTGNPSFSVITGALSAAVAANGTFTAAVPSGKDLGNFYLAAGHKLTIGSDVYFYPIDFDVSISGSTITITNKTSAATWPAAATFRLQMVEQGERAMLSVPMQDPNSQTHQFGTTTQYGTNVRSKLIPNVTAAYADLITLGAPATAAANNILASQSLASSGALTVNGALATNGVATLDQPRAIKIVSGGADTAVITFTGTDIYGRTMVENITLNGTTTVNGKKAFKTVTAARASAAVANNITAGTTDILGLPVFLPSAANIVAELRNGTRLSTGSAIVPFTVSQTDLLAHTTQELVSPIAGVVRRLSVTEQLTVVTGGTIAARVGATPVTGLSVDVANGALPGASKQTVVAPTDGTDAVAAGGRLSVTVSSTFATSGALSGSVTVSGADGTIVAGVRSAGGATATTGDVRGTYQPSVACDGASVIQLLCILPDRDPGQPQFAG